MNSNYHENSSKREKKIQQAKRLVGINLINEKSD